MLAALVIFAILAIVFGVWGFAAAVVWEGAKIIFWICVVLFVLSVIGWFTRRSGPAI